MKKVFLALLLSAVIFRTSGQNEKHVVILHTNDLHSRLYGFPSEKSYSPLQTGNDSTAGGFSRIAAIIKNEREKNKGIMLTIDGGDFLMGTLFHALEPMTGFQLRLMRKMGYDLVCLGNHEFDFGPGKLAEIIKSSEEKGDIPSVLLSNAVFSARQNEDDALESLYSSGFIKRKLILERDGLRIGVFSLLGKDASEVAPKAKPVMFEKNKSFAGKMVKELKNENCDIIICVSHSGVSKDKNGNWSGEDVELAKSVKGIDVIISGHTHTRIEKPIMVNGVPVVQTGEYGQSVGRLELTWSNGKVRVDNYNLIPVNDMIAGDESIENLIDAQRDLVEKDILEPLKIKYSDPVAESGFLLECNEQGNFKASNLGPMVADAIYNYVNKHTFDGCNISMVAAGVIRDRISPGVLITPDVFRVMSLGSGNDDVPGYPLARVYVTGKELKSILEILQVAYKSSPSNFCYYSGFKAEYDPEKGLLRKIKKIEITRPDGTTGEVDFSKKNKTLYSITANSYMLEFIGIIKKMSFGLINVTPKDGKGNPIKDMKESIIDMDSKISGIQEGKEWLALLEFLKSMKDTDGDGISDIDNRYSVPENVFIKKD